MATNVCIITAEIDEESFAVLNGLRKAHFPIEKNQLDAHITLFHHLPLDQVLEADLSLRPETTEVKFASPFFLGAGTAIEVESVELRQLRAQLAARFSSHLTAQDRQLKRLHVTIQNKVDPKVAREFFESFKEEWKPLRGRVTGLLIWEYLGGPWKLMKTIKF